MAGANQSSIYGVAFRENLEFVKGRGSHARSDELLACFDLLATTIKHLAGGVGMISSAAQERSTAPQSDLVFVKVRFRAGHYRIAKLAVHGKVILARVGQQLVRSCHLPVGSLADSGRSPSLDNVFHKSRRLDIHWRSQAASTNLHDFAGFVPCRHEQRQPVAQNLAMRCQGQLRRIVVLGKMPQARPLHSL